MLSLSDNDLAESLGRLLAVHDGRPADFPGRRRGRSTAPAQLGLPVDDVRLHDTSGLSKDDRVPPALLVDVLELATDPAHPELKSILDGLPVAGRSGTLLPRYHSAATERRCRCGAREERAAARHERRWPGWSAPGRAGCWCSRCGARTSGLDSGEQAMDRVAATLAQCGCR